ncbi:hypothetical protein H6G36_23520 [Anabaena minutissima FACHB-250]|nr:hypothetical protein [Anabaena minutissima FACHB-250]
MTTSVADKTPISATVWRRHHDPPGLWIAVAIGSVSLHLLAFWLMRSPNGFRPWFPQQSQTVVPIELVEISPQESTTKPATPQAPKTTPETAPPTSTNQDDRRLDFGGSLQQENSSNAPQPDTQVFAQEKSPQPEPTSTPTPTPPPEPTQPNPTVPLGERPWERRQDIEFGNSVPLPSDNPNVTPEQITDSGDVEEKTPRTLDEETANTSSQDSPTPLNEETASNSSDNSSNSSEETASNSNNVDTPSTPNGEIPNNSSDDSSSTPETNNSPAAENSPTANAGGFIANIMPIADTEVRQLIEQGKIRNRDIPNVFAVYQGSSTKSLDNSSSYLPSISTLQPAQLLVSLIIDQNGKFQQAEVLELPVNLQSEKSSYQQLINDLFQNDSCTPAKNGDGTPLDLSNCYIWIDIKPQTAN